MSAVFDVWCVGIGARLHVYYICFLSLSELSVILAFVSQMMMAIMPELQLQLT